VNVSSSRGPPVRIMFAAKSFNVVAPV